MDSFASAFSQQTLLWENGEFFPNLYKCALPPGQWLLPEFDMFHVQRVRSVLMDQGSGLPTSEVGEAIPNPVPPSPLPCPGKGTCVWYRDTQGQWSDSRAQRRVSCQAGKEGRIHQIIVLYLVLFVPSEALLSVSSKNCSVLLVTLFSNYFSLIFCSL